MTDRTLLRISGAAAVIGGVLRIAGTFASALGEHEAQLFYFATDLFLLTGLAGIYLSQRGSLGITGLAGTAIAALGILMIRSSALFGGYQIGAAVTIIGFAVLGVAMLGARTAKIAPLLWIGALALGIAGDVLDMNLLGLLAGIAFGAGFACAGLTLYRSA